MAAQPRRPIAAVTATTMWERFPGQWRGMLDQVDACLGRAGVEGGCNVMLYRDLPEADQIAVEVGVEVSDPFPASGVVVVSALPAGLAAETTHRGPYDVLEAAHWAVLRWCASQGREITGERWEVYGDWHEDPAQLQTRIFYGLQEAHQVKLARPGWWRGHLEQPDTVAPRNPDQSRRFYRDVRSGRGSGRSPPAILASAMTRMSAGRLSTTERLRGNASRPV